MQNLFDVRARRVNINHQIAAASPDLIPRAARNAPQPNAFRQMLRNYYQTLFDINAQLFRLAIRRSQNLSHRNGDARLVKFRRSQSTQQNLIKTRLLRCLRQAFVSRNKRTAARFFLTPDESRRELKRIQRPQAVIFRQVVRQL